MSLNRVGDFIANARTHSSVRYIAVGLISLVVDLGTLSLGWYLLRLPLWFATSVGFWCSFVVNFLLSRYWTFGAAGRRLAPQLVRYAVLVLTNYGLTLGSVSFLHALGLEVLAARVVTLAVLTISTYWLYRHWVFPQKEDIRG